jgi:hypothetical protein
MRVSLLAMVAFGVEVVVVVDEVDEDAVVGAGVAVEAVLNLVVKGRRIMLLRGRGRKRTRAVVPTTTGDNNTQRRWRAVDSLVSSTMDGFLLPVDHTYQYYVIMNHECKIDALYLRRLLKL